MAGPGADTSEFTKYYEEFKKGIFNYILYRVGFDRDTAEDLTSEIFIKAFEHFDSYDRKRPFKTWIFTIAHTHLINFRVGQKKTLPLNEAVDLVREGSKGELRQDSVDHDIAMSKIMSLVTDLPEAQREIVILRYVNDLSNNEIAHLIGKEEGAVRTALSRAIGTLRNTYNLKFSGQSHE